MWPYWMLFTVISMFAVINSSGQRRTTAQRGALPWIPIFTALVLMIGLRHEVGGDWYNYLRNIEGARGLEYVDAISLGDPAYQTLSWLFADFADGVYLVNFSCALIFCLGLISFCRSLPRPWLALATAVPYLIVVVGMGYTRQSVALGCWMLGLVALKRGAWTRFALWVILGAMFHKSAVILLPLPLLIIKRNRLVTTVAILGFFALGYAALLRDSVDELYVNYIEAQYQSEGAFIRLLMCVVPAVILLRTWRRMRLSSQEVALWRWLSMIALGLLMVLLVTPSSTAVDRVALYLLPLQLVVFAHLPDLVHPGLRLAAVAGVLMYSTAVQFVWLNYAHHAFAWLPYQLYWGG